MDKARGKNAFAILGSGKLHENWFNEMKDWHSLWYKSYRLIFLKSTLHDYKKEI